MKNITYLAVLVSFLLTAQICAAEINQADAETAKTDLREIIEYAAARNCDVWHKPVFRGDFLVEPAMMDTTGFDAPAMPRTEFRHQPAARSADFANVERYMNLKRARNLAVWTRVAEGGIPEAQVLLGLCYYHGLGVPVDEAVGVDWLLKAAEQGFEDAEYNIGMCYARGIGVPQDGKEADKWFGKVAERLRKTAEQGDTKVQIRLASFYFQGLGVSKDEAMGAIWYEKAAELGSADAQYLLALCYLNGEGVPEDVKEVEKWLRKAAAQEHEDAIAVLQNLEAQWLAEAERAVTERRRVEEARLAEERRIAEERRRVEELRLAEEKRIAEEEQRLAETERLAQKKLIDEQKEKLWREKIVLAGAINLREEQRKNGFDPAQSNSLRAFVEWGNDGLRQRFQDADTRYQRASGADKESAGTNLDLVRTQIGKTRDEIAQKTFVRELPFSTNDMKINGNESSLRLSSRTNFHHRFADTRISFPIVFPLPNIAVSEISTRYNELHMTVTGSAEHIRQLVTNSDSYLIRVRFTNLRYGWNNNSNDIFVDIQKIDIIDRVKEQAAFESATLEELQSR